MSATETRITSSTGGQKSTKPQRPGLIPGDVLLEFSQIYTKGAVKYDDNNWRKGYNWSLSIDAALRHLEQFNAGEDYDVCKCEDRPEEVAYPCTGCGATGEKHVLQCAWHCFTLAWYMDHKREFDDRAVRFDEQQAREKRMSDMISSVQQGTAWLFPDYPDHYYTREPVDLDEPQPRS